MPLVRSSMLPIMDDFKQTLLDSAHDRVTYVTLSMSFIYLKSSVGHLILFYFFMSSCLPYGRIYKAVFAIHSVSHGMY